MPGYANHILSSPALLTDLYELTMAQGYWRQGWADKPSVFQVFFRRAPFRGRFALACGQEALLDYLKRWEFTEDDIAYLQTVRGADGRNLFFPEFLEYLRGVRFSGEVLAVREGTIVFPREPIVRIQAGLVVAQLLETALLNILGFATLVGTKALRVVLAAQPDPVIEFGLRRAQGFEAGLIAARASYLAGCGGTSNVLAGKLWDIPIRGTQAHSWVLAFGNEREAFRAYLDTFPGNAILLVDTFDTLQGVQNAIDVAKELKTRGGCLRGIRLDSGNLLELSCQARRLLDEAGLHDVPIFASGDLDEYRIAKLKKAGAKINAWGVGTRLTTAFDEPALSIVYKLTAIQNDDGTWQDCMKISSEPAKQTLPGLLRAKRLFANNQAVMDVLYDERDPVDLQWPARRVADQGLSEAVDLLQPLWLGDRACPVEHDLTAARAYVREQLQQFDQAILWPGRGKAYPVRLARGVQARRQRLLRV